MWYIIYSIHYLTSAYIYSLPQVKAIDADNGYNGLITYTVSHNYEPRDLFAVSARGVVTMVQPLPHNTSPHRQNDYSLTVHATDRGVPHLSSSVKLQVGALL